MSDYLLNASSNSAIQKNNWDHTGWSFDGVFMLKYNRDCFALLQVQDSNKAALSEGLSQSLKKNSETLLLYQIMYYFELF